MATLVKFVKDKDGDFKDQVTAIFPQHKYNNILYSNDIVTAYVHNGQHTSASLQWVKENTIPATKEEYQSLLNELISIGYKDLRILVNRKNKQPVTM